jgi:hypothetical protein
MRLSSFSSRELDGGDTPRLVEAFRPTAGDKVAEIAGRSNAGRPVPDEDWARVIAANRPRHTAACDSLGQGS